MALITSDRAKGAQIECKNCGFVTLRLFFNVYRMLKPQRSGIRDCLLQADDMNPTNQEMATILG